jgi:hypothetical protein
MSAKNIQKHPQNVVEEASANVQALASVIAHFETHDLSDELENMPEITVEVTAPVPRRAYVIETDPFHRLRDLAHQRGGSPETLLNLWV